VGITLVIVIAGSLSTHGKTGKLAQKKQNAKEKSRKKSKMPGESRRFYSALES
jgi:hypothetical protein